MTKMSMRTPPDFGFLPVVYSHGWCQTPPFYWDRDGEVLTRVVPDAQERPTVLHIRSPERGSLEIVWESPALPTDGDRQAVRSAVRRMLQLERDVSAFHELCRAHPHLAPIPELGAGRFLRCPSVWEELVKAICGTNVKWSQAVRMISFVGELGEAVGRYHAWPAPERILEAGEAELRERCRLGYRAPYILQLAHELVEGSLDLGPIERQELAAPQLRKAFLSVKGIGPATADYLMILNGFTDRLSIDSAVYAYVTDRHFGGRRPAAAEIERLYEPYGEWRALAYWFEALLEWWWGSAGIDFTAGQEARYK
ncbi:MAG: DNA-3-methyladenine glycosylase 2 family protein [Gemmatimonadota bacterium]|jgi:3-methyladenine DNA glycosylase/8-oxoguanine DNA glycosylase|nr:MAG: DNA-3-methyladenine glycosylase 2 family protein [Gemmatimonadota bacterium]